MGQPTAIIDAQRALLDLLQTRKGFENFIASYPVTNGVFRETADDLLNRISQLQTRVTDLLSENKHLTEENQALKLKVEKLEKESEALKARITELEVKLTGVETESIAKDGRIVGLEAQMVKMQSNIDTLLTERDDTIISNNLADLFGYVRDHVISKNTSTPVKDILTALDAGASNPAYKDALQCMTKLNLDPDLIVVLWQCGATRNNFTHMLKSKQFNDTNYMKTALADLKQKLIVQIKAENAAFPHRDDIFALIDRLLLSLNANNSSSSSSSKI